MPDSYYPIVPVAISEVEEYDDEQLGTKKKSWVLRDDGRWWLYKQARPGVPGEAWAEKIAAEVAGLIGVSHAVIELANEAEDGLGTISLSFMPPDGRLYHGNDILFDTIPGYDRSIRAGQNEHNIANIVKALNDLPSSENAALDLDEILTGLASYAVLDGLISNSDRHHENWGLIYTDTERAYILAPSFDHASSLGRNLTDDARNGMLSSKSGVLGYLFSRPGRIFVDSYRKQGPSPLQLAQLICLAQPDITRPILERLSAVPNSEFRKLINRTPQEIMSRTARKFAHQMMIAARAELLRGFR